MRRKILVTALSSLLILSGIALGYTLFMRLLDRGAATNVFEPPSASSPTTSAHLLVTPPTKSPSVRPPQEPPPS